jgi:putative membrane protein
MIEVLQNIYPWVKALHVISVTAWMAGLFYLPRLFVYHAEVVGQAGETHMLFMTMERRLLRAIMNPSMIAAWTFGLVMVATPDRVDWSQFWPWIKMLAVLGMTWFHIWCAKSRKAFEAGKNETPGRHFRIMNEVPTLLLIIIVIMVIVQPA